MSVEMAVYVIPCIVILFVAIMIWFESIAKHRKDEKIKKRNEGIRDIFAEIGECFARQGFIFEYRIKDSKYFGWTFISASGGYINIEYYSGDEYLIELRQKNFDDPTTPNEEKVRAVIYQEIVEALIHRQRSPNSRYFLRQDMLVLKETGIEQVVAGLIGLQREYDKIWSELEDRKVLERFVAFLDLYDDEYIRYMEAIEIVVDDNSPKAEKSEIAS